MYGNNHGSLCRWIIHFDMRTILSYFYKSVFLKIPYPQCTRGQTVRMAEFAVLLRYFQSAYVLYASFKCLAELQI